MELAWHFWVDCRLLTSSFFRLVPTKMQIESMPNMTFAQVGHIRFPWRRFDFDFHRVPG